MANTSILVVGGGFSGLTAALEAAEVGHEVFIVEKSPFLGGRVAQLNKYFPKLCPPSCGLEIQFQRVKSNPLVKVFTLAEVVSVSGKAGNYEVTIKLTPRHVKPGNYDFSEEAKALSKDMPSEFELGMGTRKALHLDMPFAYPARWALDKGALTEAEAGKLAENPVVDLEEKEKTITLNVGAIVYATGWKPYDVTKLTNLGAGMVPNVVSNMQFERLSAPCGPTNGKIVRPTDGAAPKRIAFVQCAGSRDENHLNYCSYICCMASLKQAAYIREQYPEASVVIYYIDLRTPGRYDTFKDRILADPKIKPVKGKVAKIEASGQNVKVTVEDAVTGIKGEDVFDLVVLATGMQPSLSGERLPAGVQVDADGFLVGGEDKGIFAAGCAKLPLDVMKSAQSATGAALQAIQTVKGR